MLVRVNSSCVRVTRNFLNLRLGSGTQSRKACGDNDSSLPVAKNKAPSIASLPANAQHEPHCLLN